MLPIVQRGLVVGTSNVRLYRSQLKASRIGRNPFIFPHCLEPRARLVTGKRSHWYTVLRCLRRR